MVPALKYYSQKIGHDHAFGAIAAEHDSNIQ